MLERPDADGCQIEQGAVRLFGRTKDQSHFARGQLDAAQREIPIAVPRAGADDRAISLLPPAATISTALPAAASCAGIFD